MEVEGLMRGVRGVVGEGKGGGLVVGVEWKRSIVGTSSGCLFILLTFISIDINMPNRMIIATYPAPFFIVALGNILCTLVPVLPELLKRLKCYNRVYMCQPYGSDKNFEQFVMLRFAVLALNCTGLQFTDIDKQL